MNTPESHTQTDTPTDLEHPKSVDSTITELGFLLKELHEADPSSALPVISSQVDNQLIQVRLGIATSLFTALRCKYPPLANHALRVALTASLWCLEKGVPEKDRNLIEVAALLHDVGFIGVPDHVLHKPGMLDADEMQLIEHAREMSLEILRGTVAEEEMLAIVRNVPAWYDGSKVGYNVVGEQIPLGARMLSIIEAFDAMTTDHVYRRALSPERAVSELFRCGGNQFDPTLVEQFIQLQHLDQMALREAVIKRWLRSLDPEVANSYWNLNTTVLPPKKMVFGSIFMKKLLDNMHDAVIFVDKTMVITQWNHGAERLTGITSESVCQRRWSSEILQMHDEKGMLVQEADCPIVLAIYSRVQSLRRVMVQGRSGRCLAIDIHVIPVFNEQSETLGAILLLHDASPEFSLEKRCQSLHEEAIKDPLTKVANRAEFDRVLELFVDAHAKQNLSCSLVICDLDHFKRVNDTYGHQAGDEVIKSLAVLLENSCRPGDLTARYGGEEFVMLYADCKNAQATQRAENLRRQFSAIPQAGMEGRSVTASFGVTEVQPGDTPETMLRRADRGLLMAKDRGRNTVVQLGSGFEDEAPREKQSFWKRRKLKHDKMIEEELWSGVPLRVAVEKLRGFVADHQAKIISSDEDHIQLELSDVSFDKRRRRNDRSVPFVMEVSFAIASITDDNSVEFASTQKDIKASKRNGIQIYVSITTKKGRDRRLQNVKERAREVLASFRSYLMASTTPPGSRVEIERSKQMLMP